LISTKCNWAPEADLDVQLCYVDKRFELRSYAYWTGDWHARDPAPVVIDFLDRGFFGYLDLDLVLNNGQGRLTEEGAKIAAYGVLCVRSR
jgi:hypothetical protein